MAVTPCRGWAIHNQDSTDNRQANIYSKDFANIYEHNLTHTIDEVSEQP